MISSMTLVLPSYETQHLQHSGLNPQVYALMTTKRFPIFCGSYSPNHIRRKIMENLHVHLFSRNSPILHIVYSTSVATV